MNLETVFLICGAALFCFMNCVFVISLMVKKNDIADVAWGIGFIFISSITYMLAGTSYGAPLMMVFVVILWGTRLALHIWLRNWRKDEDFRYKKWRKDWGKWWIARSYLQVYLLQGLFLYIISLPLVVGIYAGRGWPDWLFATGIAVWIVGFMIEAVSDWQKLNFVKTKEHLFINTGLWRYSRHPNYFGEVLLWWGIWLASLALSGEWWTIIGPVTLTFLILFVSGIPMLEAKYAGNKEYEMYKNRTSVFVPWFPRHC